MPKLTIRGVALQSVGLRGRTNGFMTTLMMQGILSSTLIEEMGWDSALLETEHWDDIGLTSAIGPGDAVLRPNGGGEEFAFKFDQIKDFRAIKPEDTGDAADSKGKRKKKLEPMLEFKVRISTKGATGKFEKFWQNNPGIVSQMQIQYAEQAPVGPADGGKATAGLE